MILQQVLVVGHAAEVDSLAKLDQVGLLLLDGDPPATSFAHVIASAEVALLFALRVRVRHVVIVEVSRGSTTEACDRGSDDGEGLGRFNAFLRTHYSSINIHGLSCVLSSHQLTAMLPLHKLVLNDQVTDFEVETHGSSLSRTVANGSKYLLQDQIDSGHVRHAH